MTEINSLGFKCICPPNFSGLFCETSMLQPYIGGGGGGGGSQAKNLAERLKQANLDAQICRSHNCGPNGKCININNKLAHCLCQEPFYGDRCQYRDECFDNPCKANEICLHWPNNTFVCRDFVSAPSWLPLPPKQPQLASSSNFFSAKTSSSFVEQALVETNNLKLELNCSNEYCNRNGVCRIVKSKETNESSMTCECNQDKAGPRCENG